MQLAPLFLLPCLCSAADWNLIPDWDPVSPLGIIVFMFVYIKTQEHIKNVVFMKVLRGV